MTPTQQKTIIRLNDRGASAGEIAAELHITPDAVKKYLQRNTGASPVSVEETCLQCGAPFIPNTRGRPRIFCSDACRNKWWRAHQNLIRRQAWYEFTCPQCGGRFRAYGNKSRVYCSRDCKHHTL